MKNLNRKIRNNTESSGVKKIMPPNSWDGKVGVGHLSEGITLTTSGMWWILMICTHNLTSTAHFFLFTAMQQEGWPSAPPGKCLLLGLQCNISKLYQVVKHEHMHNKRQLHLTNTFNRAKHLALVSGNSNIGKLLFKKTSAMKELLIGTKDILLLPALSSATLQK